MKRIAFVSTMAGCPWGGSEELWSRAAVYLAKAGSEVHVSVLQWPKEPRQIQGLREAGCIVHVRQNGSTFFSRLRRKIRPASPWKWIAEVRPDLLLLSDGGNQVDASLAEDCARNNCPLAILFQMASESIWPSDARVRNTVAWLEKAAAVYCVSHSNLEVTRKQYGLRLPRGSVVRNPFSVPYDAKPLWPERSEVISLACVGRLEPQAKGQDLLLEVLAQPKWQEQPLKVAMYGEGPCQGGLERLRDYFGLKNVSFPGFVSNMEALWGRHHALIMPSRLEGLPLAVVEAMLCGRPCIVTDIAGNAELIEDNLHGFVAAAPTVAAVDEAMERAWAKRAQWREIGAAAAMRVRELVPRDPAKVFAEQLLELVK